MGLLLNKWALVVNYINYYGGAATVWTSMVKKCLSQNRNINFNSYNFAIASNRSHGRIYFPRKTRHDTNLAETFVAFNFLWKIKNPETRNMPMASTNVLWLADHSYYGFYQSFRNNDWTSQMMFIICRCTATFKLIYSIINIKI